MKLKQMQKFMDKGVTYIVHTVHRDGTVSVCDYSNPQVWGHIKIRRPQSEVIALVAAAVTN